MPSRIDEVLAALGEDTSALAMPPASAVRARGDARRRRQRYAVAGAVAAATAATSFAIAPLTGAAPDVTPPGGPGGYSGSPVVTATGACTSPPSPGPSGTALQEALATSRRARVLLNPNATAAEKSAIEARAHRLSEITKVAFVDHQAAWRQFAAQFCAHPDLVGATRPDQLPESYLLTITDPGAFVAVREAIGPMAGVAGVVRTLP